MIVLKILGLIVLVILALIGALVMYVVAKIAFKLLMLRFMLKKMAESNLFGGAPAVIHLRPMAASSWRDEEAIARLAEPLPALGFTRVGTFEVEEIEGLTLQAWVAPDRAITAVIYDHPSAGIFLDLFTHFEDGSRITFANNKLPREVEHAPGHTVERHFGDGTRELYEKFVAARPDKPARVITAESFSSVFEKAYNDEMAWRSSRPVDPEAYVRNPGAALLGLMSGQFKGAKTEQIRKAMGLHAYRTVTPQLVERFQNALGRGDEGGQGSARLLFVWDQMSPDMLESAAAPWLSPDDLGALSAALRKHFDDDDYEPSPRAEFVLWNETLPEFDQFRPLGTVSMVEDAEEDDEVADVYEAPAGRVAASHAGERGEP